MKKSDEVKNGYLGNYETVTVGTVLNETLPGGKWDGFLTDNDQVIAEYSTQEENNKIQFMISEDGKSFSVVHMVYDGETLQEASDCKIALDTLYGEYFKRHSELGQAENPSWDNITTKGYFGANAVKTKVSQTQAEVLFNDLAELQTASGEEMAAFLKSSGIPEIEEGFLYGDDGISILLDDVGRLDTASLSNDRYSWYGMKVGTLFPVEQVETAFEKYDYAFVLESDNGYFYAVCGTRMASSDGMFEISLDGNRIIQEIGYSSTGASELWDKAFDSIKDWVGIALYVKAKRICFNASQ